MQGQETAMLGNSVELINARAKDVRKSIEDFLHKLSREHSTMTWPTVLDSYALLSGQVSTLLNSIKSDKTPPLRNYAIVPLRLSPDPDQKLLYLTEGRVSLMSHAEVPDYLRTKPDPEVEKAERQLATEVANHVEQNPVSNQQLAQFNKQCNKVLDKIKVVRSNWRADTVVNRSSLQHPSNSNPRATQELIAAVYYGRGLKVAQTPGTN